jgi:hypothetical protein
MAEDGTSVMNGRQLQEVGEFSGDGRHRHHRSPPGDDDSFA